jgi:hypothetical protein
VEARQRRAAHPAARGRRRRNSSQVLATRTVLPAAQRSRETCRHLNGN